MVGNLESNKLGSDLSKLEVVQITAPTYFAQPNQYIEVVGNDSPPGGITIVMPSTGNQDGDLIIVKNDYPVDSNNENNISFSGVFGGVTQMREYKEMYTFIYLDGEWRTFNNWKTNFGKSFSFSGTPLTTYTVSHWVGSNPTFQLWDKTTKEVFLTDIIYTNNNTITINFKKPRTDFILRIFVT